MVRLFCVLRPAFCIVCAASVAEASARRDDGYDGAFSERNVYRYDATKADVYREAFKQPSAAALNYLLDVANERITYNKSVVRSIKDESPVYVNQALVLPKTSQRSYATNTIGSWLKLRTRQPRAFQGDAPGNTSRARSTNTPELKVNDTSFRRSYRRTTENWKFGYKGRAAVITGPRAPDRLRRRESVRYVLAGQNYLSTASAKRREHAARRVHRTALCLLVACLVLMAITVCLVIAALWLRSRYRSRGTALYSTLGVSDPDIPLPARSPPEFANRDLSPSTEVETAGSPVKLTRNSVSEPVMWASKAADNARDDIDKVAPSAKAASPEQISLLQQTTSALANETDVSETTLSPVANEPVSVTHSAQKKRKSLHVQPSKSAFPQRPIGVSRTDAERTLAADSGPWVDGAKTTGPHWDKQDDREYATAKEKCGEFVENKADWTMNHSQSEPTANGLHDITTIKGGACEDKHEPPGIALRGPYVSTSSTEPTSSVPESKPGYSDSDDFRVRLETSPLPLPTIIRRAVTKTTRRWRTAGPDTTTTSTTGSSSRGPHAQWKKSALPLAPLPQSSSADSFESLAIIKHTERPTEADCCYQMMNTGPVFPLLAQCKNSKPIDFLHVMHEDSQATKLDWDAPGCGDVFRVQGSQGDRLVRVILLRESEIPWHTSRLRVSKELSNLKDSVDNRTSAFFVDARTSLVRDKYPRLLSNARVQCDDEFDMCSPASPDEPEPVADYLVTEMQPRWCPLPNCKLTDPDQVLSVLGQACWALAVAEAELEFEHRLPSAGVVLVRPTRSPRIEFTLRGHIVRIPSAGLKVRLQGLQLARIRVGTQVEITDVTRFHEFVRDEDEVAACAKIASLLSKRPTKFEPLTNVVWLQHLADWLASQYVDASPELSHWQGVLAASCSAEHATVGSRRSRTPSGTASP
ncbi:hypothetical protein HPB50_000253 [Hyalomma asiaticum]|uniref:Uncharacterized protein n=1 Tax=Hyalomma asiaticum TaxID=266040 RepID=A0ACB7S666_HYAAI|nr:hypothetical protein HPB50_000253 [Hyalomma asiaticum]